MQDTLSQPLSLIHVDLGAFDWLAHIMLVALLTLLASHILQRLLRRLPGDVDSSFRLVLIASAAAPLRLSVWLAGFSLILDIVREHFSWEILRRITAYEPVIHILILGWFLLRLKHHLFALYGARSNIENTSLEVAEKIATFVIVACAVLMMLPMLGVSISGILAFGGIGGIVVGLAAKDILSNFFSAMMIHIDRPFSVGEWVSLPEKDIEGTVEHIGWRQVTIRTLNRRLLFVPNAMFSTLLLENPGRMTHRRIKESIGLRYQDIAVLPAIVADIREYLKQHDQIDQNEAIVVNLDKFDAYSVNIFVSAFTRQTALVDFMPIKEDVLLHIAKIIARHGADFAFPTQQLYVTSGTQMPA